MGKKILVPDGMRYAAGAATKGVDPDGCLIYLAIEEALRWLIENPIAPTLEQTEAMRRLFRYADEPLQVYCDVAVEWQRRMFLAPEPEAPEEIKDLLLPNIEHGFFKPEILNKRMAECFRRGQQSKRSTGA